MLHFPHSFSFFLTVKGKVTLLVCTYNIFSQIILTENMQFYATQCCSLLYVHVSNSNQGSHSSWKTWKNDNSFSSPGKVLEFYNFIKNPGKMGVNLEK